MRNNALQFEVSALLLAAVMACGCGATAPTPPPGPEVREPDPVPAFVGSARCLECHPEQAGWQSSHHGRAWSPPEAFAQALGADGPVEGPIVGWVGVDPLAQPLVARGGGLQAAGHAWDPAAQEWFEVFEDARQPGDRGHWTGPSMTWNSQCAPCHTTNLQVGYDPAAHRYDTVVGEQGVGCEACHGPGSLHGAEGGASVPIASPSIEVCAGCHSRRADLAPQPAPSPSFLDRYAPQLVDLGPAFHADGQVREEDFEVNAFWTSRMYAEGVRCTDCHDAHSGALLREGDGLCLECHGQHQGWKPHDHHDGAVACVDCHMPRTTYMQRHERRDHGFHLPDPALMAEVGAPDSCTRSCHGERKPSWAADALAAWGIDPSARPARSRARAVASARDGGVDGWRGALGLLQTDVHPTWRAIGAGLLGPWASIPEVRLALERAASDPDPLVRFAAVGSLPPASPTARRAMADPIRSVRVQASRRLMGQQPPGAAPMADLRTYLLAHRDQPEPALEWGGWLGAHGDPAGLDELGRAYQIWPADPMVAHAYAVHLAAAGDGAGAVAVLELAAKREASDPVLWDALGRARAGAGDLAGGVQALERAVALEPGAARTWYNLGILRDAEGDPAGALAAWGTAMAADPADPDPAWAAASLEARRGRVKEARRLNALALERDPRHEGARALGAQLGGP